MVNNNEIFSPSVVYSHIYILLCPLAGLFMIRPPRQSETTAYIKVNKHFISITTSRSPTSNITCNELYARNL